MRSIESDDDTQEWIKHFMNLAAWKGKGKGAVFTRYGGWQRKGKGKASLAVQRHQRCRRHRRQRSGASCCKR